MQIPAAAYQAFCVNFQQ